MTVVDEAAPLAGRLLGAAGSSSTVDALVVATAVEAGGAVVLTGDPDDLGALAAGQPRSRHQPALIDHLRDGRPATRRCARHHASISSGSKRSRCPHFTNGIRRLVDQAADVAVVDAESFGDFGDWTATVAGRSGSVRASGVGEVVMASSLSMVATTPTRPLSPAEISHEICCSSMTAMLCARPSGCFAGAIST